MKAYIYDIEVLPNYQLFVFMNIKIPYSALDDYEDMDIKGYWNNLNDRNKMLSIIDVKIFKISTWHDDATNLREFLKPKQILIGFNSSQYDNIMIRFFKANHGKMRIEDYLNLGFRFSDGLVNYEGKSYEYLNNFSTVKYMKQGFISIDLMSMLYLDVKKIGLKRCGIILKHYNILEFNDFTTNITEETENDVIYYCINDVLITYKLYKFSHEELKIRAYVTREYNLNCLSDSRSKVGSKIFKKLYSEYTGIPIFKLPRNGTERRIINFNEIIESKVTFKTTTFKSLLTELKAKKHHVGKDEPDDLIIYENKGYKMALGGLHSKDRPGKFISTNKYTYIDVDADSFYLAIIINNKFTPAHLSVIAFIGVIKILTEDRLLAKKTGDKIKADSLKTSIVRLFGALGSEFEWFKDPKAMYATTINGQLYLMMLIEDLELAGFEVISVNTDGIVAKVYNDRLKEYKKIVEKWGKKLKFTYGYTNYKKYIRLGVNSYMCITTDDKIKRKNDFLTELAIDKGYFAPIINQALNEYYINGTDVYKYIKNHKKIDDFLISQNIGKQFNVVHNYIDKGLQKSDILQNITRIYVSNKSSNVLKVYKAGGKKISIVAKFNTVPLNKINKTMDISFYDINYRFYIIKVMEMINKIEGNIYNRKESGKLFD